MDHNLPGTRGRIAVAALIVLASILGPRTIAQPQFRAGVDFVVLDVSVTGANGEPIRGLTRDEFKVTEDGVPQTLSTVVEVDLDSLQTTHDPLASGHRGPDVLSNDLPEDGRLIVLVFDDATMTPDTQTVNTMKAIGTKFVQGLGVRDRAAVVFTERTRGGQEFTNDQSRLLAAIETLRPGGHDFAWSVVSEPAYLRSVRTLRHVVDSVEAFTGRRKAVVYVSVGIPLDLSTRAAPARPGFAAGGGVGSPVALQQMQDRLDDELQDVLRRAQRANVNIHVADPAGLDGVAAYLRRRKSLESLSTQPPSWAVANMHLDFLRATAANTGGIVMVDTNDYAAGVSRVFSETSSYYLVGYVPVNAKRDGRFRRVEVRVTRPGATVRTKTGYSAARSDPPAPPTPQQRLERTIEGPLPLRGLPLRLGLAPVGVERKASAIATVLGVGRPTGGSAVIDHSAIDVLISAFDVTGKVAATTQFKVNLALKGGEGYFELLGRLDVPPGRYHVRAGVVAQDSNLTGSVYQDVEVGDLWRETLGCSGIILTASPGVPWLLGGISKEALPALPTGERVFRSTEQVVASVQVFQGPPGPPRAMDVRVTVGDALGKVIIDESKAVAGSDFVEGLHLVKWRLPVARMPAGAYRLTFTAKHGIEVVSRSVDLVLEIR